MALRLTHDTPRLAELSDCERTEYERFSPRFWRGAEGSTEAQTARFEGLLERPDVAGFVQDESGLERFIVESLVFPLGLRAGQARL